MRNQLRTAPSLVGAEAQIEGQAKAHNISREKVIRDVPLAQQPNKGFASAMSDMPPQCQPT